MVRRAIARPPASTKYTSPPFATDLTTPALGEAVPSNGGFGAYLMLAHNWANFDATRKSYDLIARNVFPRWQGQLATQGAADRARAARPELAAVHMKAVEAATQRYQAEAAARMPKSE